jgi:RNA polymerase sigma-70 factor (ECF subfamily)
VTTGAPPLAALAARAQLGDASALESLLRALVPGLRHHLQILLHETSDADDALQETLWLIVRRLGALRDTALVRAWAYRIATREAMHLLRRARRHDSAELTEADAVAVEERATEPSHLGVDADVLSHLDSLPAKAQVVVRLRFVEDLSQQEIAEALEIPLGTVKSRLAYGLERLRALLRPPSE